MNESDKIDLTKPLTAELVEWDDKKHYGFLHCGKARVFLHVREFAKLHKKPAVGDKIAFLPGQDNHGRTCAKHAVHVHDGGRITLVALIVLAGLLVLPVLALRHARVDWRWAVGIGLAMPALTYLTYASDKKRAQAREWRISEKRLHLLELLGGWPGAFLAQRRLRHKVSKAGYQAVFWLIVLAYQLAALDSMQDWKLSQAIWRQWLSNG